MANTLMFSVGIDNAKQAIELVKKDIETGVTDINKLLKLKIILEDADKVVQQLGKIGDNQSLKNLRDEITKLNEQFAILAKGAGGTGGLYDRGNAQKIEELTQKAERYKKTIESLQKDLNTMPGGVRNVNYADTSAELERKKMSLEGVVSQIRKLKEETATTTPTGLNLNIGGDFAKWAQEVQMVTTSVKVLVKQLKQLNQTGQKGSTQNTIFDPQQFTTLQEAIDKIIKEILRLKEVFESIGKADSFTKLQNTIESLGNLLGNFADRIKLEAPSEQIRILTERCETAEKKLMEVGEAAKYLNKQAGERTQQKATTIAGIAGLEDGSGEKVTNVSERFLKLLVEIENQMAKIGKIQLFGEQSGFSPVILKQAVEKFDALKSMVDATIKGEPIINGIAIPQTNDQLSQFIAQFALLKSSYKDIIAEADRFNKEIEKSVQKAAETEQKVNSQRLADDKKVQDAREKQADAYEKWWLNALEKRESAERKATEKSVDEIEKAEQKKRDEIDKAWAEYDKQQQKQSVSYEKQMQKEAQDKEKTEQQKRDAAYKSAEEEVKAKQKANDQMLKEEAQMLAERKHLEEQSHRTDIKEGTAGISAAEQRRREMAAAWAEQEKADKKRYDELEKQRQKDIANQEKTEQQSVNTAWKAAEQKMKADQQAAKARERANKQATNEEIREFERAQKAKIKAAESASRLTTEEQKLADVMSRTTGEASKQSQVMSDLKSMAMQYLSVYGVQSFLSNIVEIGGQLEMQRLSIGAILGDMDKANTLFEQIKAKAIKSPFGVVELDQMTKQLTAYGFQYGELYDMTMRLADISAATGTGVDRLALALGHVRSEAALSGYTLRQFSMANIPLLQKLSENLGKTTKEIRAMVRKKEVSYKDVIDVIKELTDEGGMFYNAQEVMSESVKAKWKNLRDAFAIMYGDMAESAVGDFLKNIATLLTKAAKEWDKLGVAILASATAFGTARVYMSSFNRMLGSNTASALQNIRATLQQENAYLRLYRAAGIITKEEYKTLAVREKYTASSIKVALVTNKLTVEELRRAVILGKVKKEVAEAAVVQAGYDAQLIKGVTVLSWWRKGLFLAGEGFMKLITSIKAGIVSLTAAIAPMLALTAVFEAVYHSIRQNSEAEDAGKDAAQKMKTKYDELVEVNKKLGSSEGKTTEELKKGVDQMQNALDKAGLLTPELKKQVTETDDLAKKFNILRQELQGAANDFDDLKARLEMGLTEALSVGGGSSWNPVNWFRDNMNKDINEYQESRNKFNNMINSEAARKNIEKYMRDNNLWKGGYAGMSGLELFGMLSDEQKGDWAHLSGSLLRQFGGQIDKARDAYLDYLSDRLEITGSQGKEFAEKFRDNVLNQVLNVDWKNLSPEDMIDIDKEIRRGLHGIPNADSTTKEELRKIIVDNLIGTEIPEYVKEVLEEEFTEDYGDDGEEGEDANAKLLREKVRILKEAADSYKYWREKVGEGGAIAHVNDEYGQLLGEQGFTIENVEKLRESLLKLREEYEKKPKSKDMLQAIKEIDKELADLNRNDYERSSDNILSRTQKQLDDLTRSWETFNSVREATGNIALAEQISGAQYANGQNRNIADELKKRIEDDFKSAGSVGIPFDINLDDKTVEESIKKAIPAESEERIQALVEEYKKWRDLQRDVLKNDIEVFASLIGAQKDYDSELMKINSKLEKQKQSISELVKLRKISTEEASRALLIAQAEADAEAWEKSVTYATLMNDSLVLTRQEIESGINRAMEILNEKMNANLITAQEYASEMMKIDRIQKDWSKNSLFGIGTRAAIGAKGGLDALVNYQKSKVSASQANVAYYTQKRDNARNAADFMEAVAMLERELIGLGKNQDEYNRLDSLKTLFEDFEALGKVLDPVINLFDKLGMSALGNILGAGQKALSSASSMGAGAAALFGASAGPWGAIAGAGVSLLGSVFSLFGADYSSYEKAKEEYENLIGVWDDLIDRKRTYMNESWGTEAANAAKESIRLIQAEIAQTKILAKERLDAGKGMFSHSIRYRMWQGSYDYNGQNWRDVAGSIAGKLGVRFKEMDDMLNMTSEQLIWIKENYTGLWAMMDEDFKDHLESIIKYGDDIQDVLDGVNEKLNGLSFDNLIDSYYNFVTASEDANDMLAEDLEGKLKEAIVKGMIENLYRDKINAILKQASDLGKNASYVDSNGNIRQHVYGANGTIADQGSVASEYTREEYNLIMQAAQTLGDQEKATYEMLKGMYNWTDGDRKSSGLSKTIQGTSEEISNLLASYLNAVRADVSINKSMIAEYFPQYLAVMTSGNESLRNIESNTAAIMRSNDAIAESISSLDRNVIGLKNKTWKMPIA